jgi:hypothetical protein
MVALAAAAFAGCATTEPPAPPASSAPPPPTADFPDGLRCMDNLLLEYGTRELPLAVEDLDEAGPRAGGSSRNALIGALSEMSRRSRLVRLVDGPGGGAPHLLRGSFAMAGSGALSADFRLLAARDRTVVPGIGSHNETQPVGGGRSVLRKFGRDTVLPADAAGARRALIELGAIETIGRLAKVPYWSCLGGSDADPDVAAEIKDWYDAMAARPREIIEYLQQQLKLRGVYDGPVDGAVNEPFKDAVATYREALGLSREPKLSKDFFQAYLAADHRALLAKVKPAPAPAPAAPPAPPPAATAPAVATAVPTGPLALRVAAAGATRGFERGQSVELVVRPSRDSHVYCYHQDENRQIARFFPNRFHRASRVDAEGVKLPGAMRFEIRMNTRGVPEAVSCLATDRDVLAELPAPLNAPDFAPLPLTSLDQVRDAFKRVGAGTLAQDSLQLRPR